MSLKTVTQTDITNGFRALELSEGDAVFVHSSLRSFGHVDGGAETVVRAFLEVIGASGTLGVPIFHRYFMEGVDQVWDRHQTPSLMGRLTETVRTWPGAFHSGHAIHPVAAIGGQAQDFADRDHKRDFDEDSPFQWLVDHDAWIALLGVTYQNCTQIHLIEERLEIPYRRWVERAGTVVDGKTRTFKTYHFFERYPGVGNDFMPLGLALEKLGRVHIGTIGQSTVRLFKARHLVDVGMEKAKRDPLFLVSEKTKTEGARYV